MLFEFRKFIDRFRMDPENFFDQYCGGNNSFDIFQTEDGKIASSNKKVIEEEKKLFLKYTSEPRKDLKSCLRQRELLEEFGKLGCRYYLYDSFRDYYGDHGDYDWDDGYSEIGMQGYSCLHGGKALLNKILNYKFVSVCDGLKTDRYEERFIVTSEEDD